MDKYALIDMSVEDVFIAARFRCLLVVYYSIRCEVQENSLVSALCSFVSSRCLCYFCFSRSGTRLTPSIVC